MPNIAKPIQKSVPAAYTPKLALNLELQLNLAAYLLLGIHLFWAVAIFFLYPTQDISPFVFKFFGSVTLVFGGYLWALFFWWMAATLRAQTTITETHSEAVSEEKNQLTFLACSNCDARLYSETHCESCGYEIAP